MRHFLLICFLLCCLCVEAQFDNQYNFTFKTYTTLDGLAHNFTRKCKADSKGFLWIATQNGLSRFDGYQFTNFTHDPKNNGSIPSNFLWDIDIDSQNRIWIAYESGVCCYDPSAKRFKVVDGLKNYHFITKLAVDVKKEVVWIACIEGLLKLDINTRKLFSTKLHERFPNDLSSMTLDSKEHLWITVHRYGYYRYDCLADTFHYYNYNCWPMNVFEDSENSMWISTWSNGFQRFDNGTGENRNETYALNLSGGPSLIAAGAAECTQITGQHLLWVIHHSTGISLFDVRKRHFVKWFRYQPDTKSGISTDFNNSIYTAPDGTLWICTWHGLEKVNQYEQQFHAVELPQLNGNLYNLLTGLQQDRADKDIIWLAVKGSGIAKYSRIRQSVVKWYFKYSSDSERDRYGIQRWVNSLFIDSNKIIWGVTSGGFIKIKKGKVSFRQVKDSIGYNYSTAGFQDKSGRLWSAGSQGLSWLNPYTGQHKMYRVKKQLATSPFSIMFSAVTQGSGGELYAASYNGIYRFTDFASDTSLIPYWKKMPDSDEWKNCYDIECIENHLFIGTRNGLLDYDLLTGHLRGVGIKPIKVLTYNAMQKDASGNLWIYTIEGLYRYTPDGGALKLFSQPDGVYASSDDPTSLFSFDGYMYLGHRMAFTRFKPAETGINLSKAYPYLTDVEVAKYTSTIAVDSFKVTPLQLTYRQNNIKITFSAIEYNNPAAVQLRYRLAGFDSEWQQAKAERKTTYTNLPEGTYAFFVKAVNSAGLENDSMAIFKFSIAPPWWHTWWLRLALVLAGAGILYGLFRIRIRQIKKEETRKTNMQKAIAGLEMKALRSQMNPHFIFNSLNSVQKYIWENRQEDASEYLTKFARLIRLVLANSLQSLISLSEELDALRIYVELECRRNNQKFSYNITLASSFNTDQVRIPPLLLQPYAENAIWHGLSPKDTLGTLNIIIDVKGNKLLCIIEDDGIGRKKAQELKQYKTFAGSLGMNISSQRIAWLENETGLPASVEVVDKYSDGTATGTRVSITLPLIHK